MLLQRDCSLLEPEMKRFYNLGRVLFSKAVSSVLSKRYKKVIFW